MVPILRIMESLENGDGVFRDEQIVRVAGIVEKVRMKTTRSNSMMAYVTLEDATGSMELLVFSRVLAESGPYLKANLPVAVSGKISIRDEKEPQLMVDRVVPLGKPDVGTDNGKVLWIRLENGGPAFQWLRKLLEMFPGKDTAIVYLADSRKKLQTQCVIHEALLAELNEVLGSKNVVLK